MESIEACKTCQYYDYLAKQRERFGICRLMTYNAGERVQIIPQGDTTVVVREDHYCSEYQPK